MRTLRLSQNQSEQRAMWMEPLKHVVRTGSLGLDPSPAPELGICHYAHRSSAYKLYICRLSGTWAVRTVGCGGNGPERQDP